MSDYNDRAERTTARYEERLSDIESAMNDLRAEKAQVVAERDNELDALERTWATEHGFPVGARVEVDFDGYVEWRKANGYTVPPLIKPGDALKVSSVTVDGFVMVVRRGLSGRGLQRELLLGVGTVPAQYVTVVEEGE